jgi:shikimate dehydrogenase
MKKKMHQQNVYGLLGKNISYSFSKKYFTNKFKTEFLENCVYLNFDIQTIEEFSDIIKENKKLRGFNVTIPYKENILPYLTHLNKKAQKIGAVNCVKISKKGTKLKGYNTDFYGFKKALQPMLQNHHKKALIFGTGGASKAVAFALKKLNISYKFVSRNPIENQLNYQQLTKNILEEYTILINTTPVGTLPNVQECITIPYELVTKKHIAYDLVYNPEETLFLKKCKKQGATTTNGYQMLVFQAEKSWEIWNK